MSAFGSSSGGGSSGLSSLLSGSAANAEQNESSEQAERTTQLEREVSTLTNENLKLKENVAELQLKLEE